MVYIHTRYTNTAADGINMKQKYQRYQRKSTVAGINVSCVQFYYTATKYFFPMTNITVASSYFQMW